MTTLETQTKPEQLSHIDKLFIIRGLEHMKSMSIIETSEVDGIIQKVQKL